MDDEDFYIDHLNARLMFEAMMYAGGFRIQCSQVRRYSPSPDLSPIRRRSISPESRKGEVEVLPYERFQVKKFNSNEYSQIADKNAEALIKEEEEAKLKAEKKKAKKERQKQKKREIAESNPAVNNPTNSDGRTNKLTNDFDKFGLNPDNKETEGLDVHAAFVSKAIKKVKNTSIITEEPKTKKEVKDIHSMIKMALEYENSDNYKEAVQFYSDAINLAPKRFDLILKRSYIYYQLAKFEKSVRDAQKVVQHSPNNADAHFRLGEAHFALNNLSDAEAAFTKLLNLNSYCNEAQRRLFSIRIKQLEEMGYHPNEAFTALLKSKNKTLDEAIEFLTDLENGKETTEDLYYSDEDESEEEYEEEEEEEDEEGSDIAHKQSASSAISKPAIVINNRSPLLIDPSNPFQCCSLFVGNLKKDITYKEMHDVFIKFGEISSIKLTTEPNCYAFVNFCESDAAGRAMEALQSSRWLLSTVPLLVKFPTKAVNNAITNMKNPELILSKWNALKELKSPTGKSNANKPTDVKHVAVAQYSGVPVVKPPQPGRMRQPPQTEECFYWRTSGCTYGNKCFNLHIPGHENIDARGRRPFRP